MDFSLCRAQRFVCSLCHHKEQVLAMKRCFFVDEKVPGVTSSGSFVVLHRGAVCILCASVSKCPWAQWGRAEVWAVPTAPPPLPEALAHNAPCLWQQVVQGMSQRRGCCSAHLHVQKHLIVITHWQVHKSLWVCVMAGRDSIQKHWSEVFYFWIESRWPEGTKQHRHLTMWNNRDVTSFREDMNTPS